MSFISLHKYAWVVLIAVACAACKSDALKPVPGEPCLMNSDCKDPLSCTFGLCHEACAVARDCPSEQTCVIDQSDDKGTRVCQLTKEKTCGVNSDCAGNLVCGNDLQCRNQCEANKDCATKSQICVDHVCAEPFDVTKDPDSGAVVLKPAKASSDAGMSGGEEGAKGGRSAAGEGGRVSAAGSGGSAGAAGATGGAGGRASAAGSGGSAGTAGAGGKAGAAGGGTGMITNSVSSCQDADGFHGFHPSNLPADLAVPSDLPAWSYSYCGFSTNDRNEQDPMTSAPHWITSCTSNKPDKTVSRVVKLTDGREAAVLFLSELVLPVGAKLVFSGDRPLIIVASGRVEIDGTISAAADSVSGWVGGGAPGPATANRPGTCPIDDIPGGGRPGSSDSSSGLGPSGGGFCGKGGAGSTDLMGTAAAVGGMTYGSPELVPLVGGSSGGTGTGTGTGGAGGAALQIISAKEILIGDQGIIHVGGGGGYYAGAGGSGGAILLEAPTVTVRGVLAANGGAGGDTGTAAVSDAQASDQQAAPTYHKPGKGAAGDIIDGGPANPAPTELYYEGGGGGAGRIRINTGCGGKLTVASSSIISPHRGTDCFSSGGLL